MKKPFPTKANGKRKDYKYFMRHGGYGQNSQYRIYPNEFNSFDVAVVFKKAMAIKLLEFLNDESYK